MDTRQAIETLNDELTRIAQRRRQHLLDAEQCALEIGARTSYLRDQFGQSKAASAARAGVSPSHLTEWISDARDADIQVDDPLQRIPLLRALELATFLLDHGGLTRIVASFSDNDCFFLSEVHPDALRTNSAMRRPNMMVQAVDGEWAEVDNVNVGYGGTGPTNALQVLEKIGLDEPLARDIAFHRVSDVHFDGGPDPSQTPFHTHEWPLVSLSTPRPVGDIWVIPMGPDDLVDTDARSLERDTHGGFYARSAEGSHLERWLTVLDQPPHSSAWSTAPRRARVYLDHEMASSDGFSDDVAGLPHSGYLPSTYTIIIEQGWLQLWLSLPTSNDPGTRFTPETYEVLRLAGFYVDDLEERDNRSAFWRWLSRLGETKPPFVDLGGRPVTQAQAGGKRVAR